MARPHVHIEMSGHHHALTDGAWKYIWTPSTGDELLFDLTADPQEASDLSSHPDHGDTLAHWRAAMITALRDRPEGFVQNDTLAITDYTAPTIPGSPADRMMSTY